MSEYGCDLVALGAHPDDIEFCCGGLVAKAVRSGQSVTLVDLTLGELGSRGTVEIRKEEARAAAEVLGVKVRENLKLPDGRIDAYAGSGDAAAGTKTQLDIVVDCLRRHRPEILLVPFPKCRHPDHIAAGTLITRAVFFAGAANFQAFGFEKLPSYAPRQVLYYQMRYKFHPSFIVDISRESAVKYDALRCHASQLGLDGKSGLAKTLISSALSVEALEARDRYFGAMIGVTHGEPYFIHAALSIGDPLTHFRANPVDGALIFPEQA
ncbi:MAG: bacillithiol biosynthesis deacetylase BshB1 [Bdellovibrionales bacterium]|nr:bacillithiol biosynthesis deacetylase BshB1 [Bdellovibrionales bacterium]